MTALQRLGAALKVGAAELRTIAALMLEVADELDAAKAAEHLRRLAAAALKAADELDAQTPEVTHG